MNQNYDIENNKALEVQETIVADAVAEEILKEKKNENKRSIILILILVFCLIFLTSAVTFAAIGPGFSNQNKQGENVINTGSILFSYSQGSNRIEINNAFPTSDEVGKNLHGEKEFFDFVVSVDFVKTKKRNLNYEISITPDKKNTLSGKYIRVYLLENEKEILINEKAINNFSDLPNSKIHAGSKTLTKFSVTDKIVNFYVFRMWLSENYNVGSKVEEFKCFINVDAY